MTEDPGILFNALWVPDLEIYGLEDYSVAKTLKDMSGLRIRKDKTIQFNTRSVVGQSFVLFSWHFSFVPGFLWRSPAEWCLTRTHLTSTHANSRLGAVSVEWTKNRLMIDMHFIFLDFYLKDTLTCTSRFTDPANSDRQRNLQYQLQFLELEEEDKIMELDSGNAAFSNNWILNPELKVFLLF